MDYQINKWRMDKMKFLNKWTKWKLNEFFKLITWNQQCYFKSFHVIFSLTLVSDVASVKKHYMKKKFTLDFFKALPLWICHYAFQCHLFHMNVYGRVAIEMIVFSGPFLLDMALQGSHYFKAMRQEVKCFFRAQAHLKTVVNEK